MSARQADLRLKVRVRPAAALDVEDLAVLLGQLGYPVASDALAKRLERPAADESAALFVAVTSDEVVGMAALHVMQVVERDEPSARLIAFVVREDVRGRGSPVCCSEASRRPLALPGATRRGLRLPRR